MKKTFLLVMILWCSLGHSCVQVQAAEAGADRLTIIFDTSSSAGSYINDFTSLATQAITSHCGPGDYLEVISADSGKPTLKVTRELKTASIEEFTEISKDIKEIRPGFLSNASIGNALALAYDRLQDPNSAGGQGGKAIIIFSDGRLSDGDAQRVIALSEKLTAYGCDLYMTGTNRTNKAILLAANDQKLTFSLVGEANLASWLTSLGWRPHEPEPPTAPAPSEPQEVLPDLMTDAPAHVQPIQSDPASRSDYEVRTSMDSRVSITSKSEPQIPPVSPPVALEAKPEPVVSPNVPPVPEPKPVARPGIWARITKPLRALWPKAFWWVLLPLIVLTIVFGTIYLIGSTKARKWQQSVTARLNQGRRTGEHTLIVRVNGNTHRLGRLEHFTRCSIGRGLANAIRIDDKNVAEQHLRLIKRREGLVVRNLSSSPISVNGSTVKPRHKQQLILPAAIELTEKIKLNVELVTPKVSPPVNRRDIHEEQAQ